MENAITTTTTLSTIPAAIQSKLGALKSPALRASLTGMYTATMAGQRVFKEAAFEVAKYLAEIDDTKSYKVDGFKSRAQAVEAVLGIKETQASRDIKTYRVFKAENRASYDTFLYENTAAMDALRDLADMKPDERKAFALSRGWVEPETVKKAVQAATEAVEIAEKALESVKAKGNPEAVMEAERALQAATEAKEAAEAKPKAAPISTKAAREAVTKARESRNKRTNSKPISMKHFMSIDLVGTWAKPDTATVTAKADTLMDVPKASKGDYSATVILDGKAFTVSTTPKGYTLTIAVPVTTKEEPASVVAARNLRDKAIAALIAAGMDKATAEKTVDKATASKAAKEAKAKASNAPKTKASNAPKADK